MKKFIEAIIALCAGIAAIISGYLIFFQPAASTKNATSSNNSSKSTTNTNSSSSISGEQASLQDGTYTGAVESTDRGDYQIQMTVASGKITAIDILEYPDENDRSEQINSNALPTYTSEAIDSQSATGVNQISGATEAFKGFTGSLQDAINQAGNK